MTDDVACGHGRLHDKVCIVTGAGSPRGIGCVIAELYCDVRRPSDLRACEGGRRQCASLKKVESTVVPEMLKYTLYHRPRTSYLWRGYQSRELQSSSRDL